VPTAITVPTSTGWTQDGEQHLGDTGGLLHRDGRGNSGPGERQRQVQDDADCDADADSPHVVHGPGDDLPGRSDRLEVCNCRGLSPALDSCREVSSVTTAWATTAGKGPADVAEVYRVPPARPAVASPS